MLFWWRFECRSNKQLSHHTARLIAFVRDLGSSWNVRSKSFTSLRSPTTYKLQQTIYLVSIIRIQVFNWGNKWQPTSERTPELWSQLLEMAATTLEWKLVWWWIRSQDALKNDTKSNPFPVIGSLSPLSFLTMSDGRSLKASPPPHNHVD